MIQPLWADFNANNWTLNVRTEFSVLRASADRSLSWDPIIQCVIERLPSNFIETGNGSGAGRTVRFVVPARYGPVVGDEICIVCATISSRPQSCSEKISVHAEGHFSRANAQSSQFLAALNALRHPHSPQIRSPRRIPRSWHSRNMVFTPENDSFHCNNDQ